MQILLPTYDAYNFLVPSNIACFRKHWPKCTWEIVVVNGGKRQINLPSDANTKVVYIPEDKNYGSNLIHAIDTAISDEHILIWLDDYLLYYVDLAVVGAAVELLHEPEIESVRLSQMYTPVREPYAADGRFTPIDMKDQYSFSQQAAFWDTSVFRSILKEGEDPWQTELVGSGRISGSPEGTFHTFLGVLVPALGYHNILHEGGFDVRATQWLLSQAEWPYSR